MGYVRLQEVPFSLDQVLAELKSDPTGGITFYVGTVRRREAERTVDALTYEVYPEMAESTLERLRRETIQRFGLLDAIAIHRTGRLPAGEPILVVALAAAHRGETFEAVRFFMDQLKSIVPIWKKEESSEGATWILGAEGRREVA